MTTQANYSRLQELLKEQRAAEKEIFDEVSKKIIELREDLAFMIKWYGDSSPVGNSSNDLYEALKTKGDSLNAIIQKNIGN